MQIETKVKLFNISRKIFAFFLLLTALGRIGSAHVQTTGYIATDFLLPSDFLSVVFGVFELVLAGAIAKGYKSVFTSTIFATYLIALDFTYHQFWSVEPQFQFEQQTLFFKTILTAFGALGFGLAQSIIEERKK
jgi:uncharacterized membrane protein YphA (DoxX/SURF4 family)